MLIARTIQPVLEHHLQRGKSLLLLGPRQTGKTTLVGGLAADLVVTLVAPRTRHRYERDPGLLAGEVRALPRRRGRMPLVVADEVQRVPELLDVGQELIDAGAAQFVFTGSSARKLRQRDVNLLPGRVVALHLDPLTLEEHAPRTLEDVLWYGALPAIRTQSHAKDRTADLRAYVETYLEEEVRQEAVVRNLGAFGRFLELAAQESGRIANFSKLAHDVGVSSMTIKAYYEILVDCLVAERLDPLVHSRSRKKLTKSSRYLFFDLGVRRLAAREGTRLPRERMGELFEQFVGLEAVRFCRAHLATGRVRFWRDPDGPEVDWVVENEGQLLPIEVKLTDTPTLRDARHLAVFLEEYRAERGVVVCTVPRSVRLNDDITAIPWQQLPRELHRTLAAAAT